MEKANKKEKTDRYYDPFPSRLRDLMENHHPPITRQNLAEFLGVTPQQISNYTVGTSLPDFNCICKLADFFKISSDYLLGISEYKNPDINIREISKITGLTELSIEKLKRDAKYICELGHTDIPQEGLNTYLSKYGDKDRNLYPNFHTINLLLADSPTNLNYEPIIEKLGEILAFRMQPKNIKPHEEIYYGLFKHLDEVRVDEDGYEDDFIFDTDEDPSYFLGHNEILDILLLQLQGTIKRYKDEHEKDCI